MEDTPKYIIPNLRNAFLILDYLRKTGQPLTVTRASRAVGVPKTSALRILKTMELCGAVERNGMEYSVGELVRKLADSARSRENLKERIHPFLVELTKATGETSHLCIPVKDMGFVVRECSTWQSLRSISVEGSFIDLSCSSAGKIILADMLGADPKFVAGVPLVKRTPKSVSSRRKLAAQLAEIARRGWALDDEEYNLGARCVSVPLRDESGAFVGALGVTGPCVRMNGDFIAKTVRILLAAAEKFARANTAYLRTRA